jgi:hypothetical protein
MKVVRMLLLVAAAAALVVLVVNLQKKRQAADIAVQDIEGELAELDPATRAAAVAKLSADEAEHIKSAGDGGS